MNIFWLGCNFLKIQSKNNVICTDPYSEKTGLKIKRKLKADFLILSNFGDLNPEKINAEHIINEPGEYEIEDILIYGIPSTQSIFYRIEIENIKIGYLPGLKDPLNSIQLDFLSGIEVLFIPVGGYDVATPKVADQVIGALEPNIIIPIDFKINNLKYKRNKVDDFLKYIGVEKEELDSLKLDKKSLLTFENKVLVLKPNL